jgi:hypothetical protein
MSRKHPKQSEKYAAKIEKRESRADLRNIHQLAKKIVTNKLAQQIAEQPSLLKQA